MKYAKDPDAIFAKYESASKLEDKALLYILYQFFRDLERMKSYLELDVPPPILHMIMQYLTTDAIYLTKHTGNIHIQPYLDILHPMIKRKIKEQEQRHNGIRISIDYHSNVQSTQSP